MGEPKWKSVLVSLALLALHGCFGTRQGSGNDSGAEGTGGATSSAGNEGSGSAALGGSDRGSPESCLGSGTVAEVPVTGVDKVDLLLVIDSSSSMRGAQEKLRKAIPGLVETLATGTFPDGSTFPPAKDLHLGVITADMGVPGALQPLPETFNCAGYGDDGILRVSSSAEAPACSGDFPSFISYQAGGALSPSGAATQLGCLAEVGPNGCGFQMQLEAPLKALWPALDIDPSTGKQWVNPMTKEPDNRITFLSDQPPAATFGHGDGLNSGFLRNDPVQGQSVIAIMLVTDVEDCSARTVEHLNYPPIPGSKFDGVPPNLVCWNFPEKLWPAQRYTDGLRALRSGNEDLVVFGAIAGVPQGLVTPEKLAQVDFNDESARDAYYSGIRTNPKMVPTLRSDGSNVDFSCRPRGAGPMEGAYPPLRILDVVEGFGENGVMQSICEDDFGPAMDAFASLIAKQLGQVCLPRKLARGSDGEVDCRLLWELPKPGTAPESAPTRCDDLPFLTAPSDASEQYSQGRARCVVNQLRVADEAEPVGQGWYYDDFSDATRTDCRGTDRQRIAFTDTSSPAAGTRVFLDCEGTSAKDPGPEDPCSGPND